MDAPVSGCQLATSQPESAVESEDQVTTDDPVRGATSVDYVDHVTVASSSITPVQPGMVFKRLILDTFSAKGILIDACNGYCVLKCASGNLFLVGLSTKLIDYTYKGVS